MAMAYRAGAELAGTLVTEAVRDEGGRLYNSSGERFMARYDRERMELSAARSDRPGHQHQDRRRVRHAAPRGGRLIALLPRPTPLQT